jgi:hypothetical protein
MGVDKTWNQGWSVVRRKLDQVMESINTLSKPERLALHLLVSGTDESGVLLYRNT